MNTAPLTISGPYAYENLTVFLFHGPDQVDGSHYVPLHAAMEEKHVIVYETGNVRELEAENLSDTSDIFIQAGDVLKGGRQDRTIAIDFIVPAKSGRIPIPAFCVESGRWQKRKAELQKFFSCSSHTLHAKRARLAAKLKRSQSAVWESVAECQEDIGASLGKSVHSEDSPTSYQLSMEQPALQRRTAEFKERFMDVATSRDILGYAFYVNGERNTADVYGSTILFHKLWDKLLDVAILEAISTREAKAEPVAEANVQDWLRQAAQAGSADKKSAPPRTRIETSGYLGGVVFETFDEAIGNGAVLHTNIISR